ncbi:MAG: MBL fold metallo-hydrolase [Phycisphaerales bacterium]
MNIVSLRLIGVTCHLLMDDADCVLIDTGLIGGARAVRRTMREHDREPGDLRAILLTHGHLDHTAGLAEIAEWSDAPVYAHPADQPHIDGMYRYRGWASGCGMLEATGRMLLRYRRRATDQPLNDGQVLPWCGGLRVVHLPGHTAGHCGFYSEPNDTLFCGDLCWFGRWSMGLPPRIFNSCSEHFSASIARVLQLNPAGIVANHYCRKWSAKRMREMFDRIAERTLRVTR